LVGDVHGNLPALRGLWDVLVRRAVPHVVFLGDYINKGARSAEVLEDLISHSQTGRATLLAGNHEVALLDALDRKDLRGFLKIGGPKTIVSYVGGRVGPDVLEAFAASLPPEHLQALRGMRASYETEDLIAQHLPPRSSTPKFRVSAHVPIGKLPRIERRFAYLDTGCGSDSGRLTALLWPALDYVQVDCNGALVTDAARG
jgi:serine/threonine protein phosphatase 1